MVNDEIAAVSERNLKVIATAQGLLDCGNDFSQAEITMMELAIAQTASLNAMLLHLIDTRN